MIGVDDIQAAARRIENWIRRTPSLTPPRETWDPDATFDLSLKLECLQVTGSFKPRGAFNKVLSQAKRPKGLTTSSGGNHGIAVAHVGRALKIPVTIPLPATVAPEKIAAMRALGAEATIAGLTFHESNARAKEIAEERGFLYVHPFADPLGIAGQGTCGLEILQASPHLSEVIVAVGGGGLLGGIAAAIKGYRPAVRVTGVEPKGANALTRSLEAGRLVTLEKVETRAATLAPPMTEAINLELAQAHVDRMINLDDAEIEEGARWLWRTFSVATELAGAAAAAALIKGHVAPRRDETVCCVVCGAGTAGC
jgi:threonine dehydratase